MNFEKHPSTHLPDILKEHLPALYTSLFQGEIHSITEGFVESLSNNRYGDLVVSADRYDEEPGFRLLFLIQQYGTELQEVLEIRYNLLLTRKTWIKIFKELKLARCFNGLKIIYKGEILNLNKQFVDICEKFIRLSKEDANHSYCIIPYADWIGDGPFDIYECKRMLRQKGYRASIDDDSRFMFGIFLT